MSDQEIFCEKSNEIFNLVLKGLRDISEKINGIDLVDLNSIQLSLRINMCGRNVNSRIYIPSFDVFGCGLDLFRLGLFAWIYSRQFNEDCAIRFFDGLGGDFSGVIFSMSGFSSGGGAKSRKALIMRVPPRSSCLYSRGGCLAFGVFDRNSVEFCGGVSLVNPPQRAMVINSSRQGFEKLGQWLMSLGALEGAGFSLFHGGRSVISRLSYEVRFLKFENYF